MQSEEQEFSRIKSSFILNRDVVLVSHQQPGTDFSKCINIVKYFSVDIPISEERKRFSLHEDGQNLALNIIVTAGNVFGCVSLPDVPRYICFLFLSKVCDKMEQQASLIKRSYHASEHEFDRDFKPVLSRLMDEFNKGNGIDKLSAVEHQVQDVKEIILQNVEKIIERGEKLDDLLNKTNDLEAQGRAFRQTARTLEVRMWWKNVWLWFVIGVILSLCVLFAILYFAKVFKH